jgi:hypothetical protein
MRGGDPLGQRGKRGAGALVTRVLRLRAGAGVPRGISRAAARTLVAVGLGCAIAGCAAVAAPPPVVAPVKVEVPVLRQIPCPLPRLSDPALPLAALRLDSPPADTIRAYAASVAILKGAVRQRDALLAGCAEPATTVTEKAR